MPVPLSRSKIAASVTLASLGALTGAALSAGGGSTASVAKQQAPPPRVVTQVVTEATRRVRHVRTRVIRRSRQHVAPRAAPAAAAPRPVVYGFGD